MKECGNKLITKSTRKYDKTRDVNKRSLHIARINCSKLHVESDVSEF